jgi:hypothetical protein
LDLAIAPAVALVLALSVLWIIQKVLMMLIFGLRFEKIDLSATGEIPLVLAIRRLARPELDAHAPRLKNPQHPAVVATIPKCLPPSMLIIVL